MRITGFDVRRVAIPLAETVQWVGASESVNDVLMLRLSTDAGCFGLSQKKVHLGWSSAMTMAQCATELEQVYRPLLMGRDALDADAIWASLDGIAAWSPCKVLIDIALHDLAARAAGLPMWRYLGGESGDVAVLGFIARGKTASRIALMHQQIDRFGFTGFKIKVGSDADEDIAFIAAARSEFGDQLLLRADANWGYAAPDVLRIAERLAKLNVADFEDPCDLTDRALRRDLFANSALPLVIDNSINSRRAALEAIDDGAPRMALKVSRLGYRISHQIVDDCIAAQVKVVAGSMTESAIGALGAIHFYAGHPAFAFSPAEDGYFLTLKDDVSPRPAVTRGIVALGDGPGLSPDWDDKRMQRYSRALEAAEW